MYPARRAVALQLARGDGAICSLVYDIPARTITTMLDFSRGIRRMRRVRTGTKGTQRIWRGGGRWRELRFRVRA